MKCKALRARVKGAHSAPGLAAGIVQMAAANWGRNQWLLVLWMLGGGCFCIGKGWH